MATINDLKKYNDNKRDLLKVQTLSDGIILFTEEEAKKVLINYIVNELDIFSDGVSKEIKKELDHKIGTKLIRVEKDMFEHINDKLNKIAEKVVNEILDRKMEEEINKRVEEKLNKIKQLL